MGTGGIRISRIGIVWAVAAALSVSCSAWAKNPDALIIVGADSSSTISNQINTRLSIIGAVQNLSPLYASTNLLNSQSLSASDLASAILGDSAASHVDVLILSREPDLNAQAVLTAGQVASQSEKPFSNLRLVYLAGESSQEAVSGWQAAGATIAVGQSDFTSSSSLSSQRFISRWAEGWDAQAAAGDAATYAEASFESLGNAAQIAAQAGLTIRGQDVNRTGNLLGAVSVSQAIEEPASPLQEKSEDASQEEHSAFERAVLAASTSLVPAIHVDSAKLGGTQDFLNQAGPLAWQQLQNVFSSGAPTGAASAGSQDSLPQDISVDGEFLQYILSPLQKYMGGKLNDALAYLKSVTLTRTATNLDVTVEFTKNFDLQLKDRASVKILHAYAVHVPKVIHVSIEAENGTLHLRGLDARGPNHDRLFLRVKVPVLSLKVYVRELVLDLASGDLHAEAAILADKVRIVAEAQIFANTIQPKFDFWQSVEDNLDLFNWPELTFGPELSGNDKSPNPSPGA